jgi:hypothetical protein
VRRLAAALAAAALAGCGAEPEVYEGPVFDDPFDEARGWPQQSAGGGAIVVRDGQLVLRGERPRGLVFGAQLEQQEVSRDTLVEARLTITDGAVAGAGVTCRAGSRRGGPELYGFIVTADGIGQIVRVDIDGIRVLGSAEVPEARGGRPVDVRGECDGNEMRLTVAGREVLEETDRELERGRGGVLLLVGDDAPAEARFDRLVVRTGS